MIELTLPADLDRSTCSDGSPHFWLSPDLSGAGDPWDPNGGLCRDLAGNIDDVYAIDINGHRAVLAAVWLTAPEEPLGAWVLA